MQGQEGYPFSGMPMGAYIPPPLGLGRPPTWTLHRMSDGRVYYFNNYTQQSTWTKPDELKTPEELARPICTWKEFTAETGKKYYYNSVSKVTTWDMPQEYRDWMESQTAATTSTQAKSATPLTPFMQEEPKFATHEEAVKGFKRLLIEAGTKVDWGWEQTLRAIIHSPMYRAIKSVSEKRQVYNQLIEELKGREVSDKKQAQRKLKENFKHALRDVTDISSSSRYRTIRDRIKDLKEFSAIGDEKDREDVFYEYVDELYEKEKEILREKRLEMFNMFYEILDSTPQVNVNTTWKEFRDTLLESEIIKGHDEILKTMDKSDMLTVFEDFIRDRNRIFWDDCRREKEQKRRTERKNREAFKLALKDLLLDGRLHALMTWSDVHRILKEDHRYSDLLGQPGSTPVDLFHDLLDGLKTDFESSRESILKALENMGIDPKRMKLRDFVERSQHLSDKTTLELIYRDINGGENGQEVERDLSSADETPEVDTHQTVELAHSPTTIVEDIKAKFRLLVENLILQLDEILPWDEFKVMIAEPEIQGLLDQEEAWCFSIFEELKDKYETEIFTTKKSSSEKETDGTTLRPGRPDDETSSVTSDGGSSRTSSRGTSVDVKSPERLRVDNREKSRSRHREHEDDSKRRRRHHHHHRRHNRSRSRSQNRHRKHRSSRKPKEEHREGHRHHSREGDHKRRSRESRRDHEKRNERHRSSRHGRHRESQSGSDHDEIRKSDKHGHRSQHHHEDKDREHRHRSRETTHQDRNKRSRSGRSRTHRSKSLSSADSSSESRSSSP